VFKNKGGTDYFSQPVFLPLKYSAPPPISQTKSNQSSQVLGHLLILIILNYSCEFEHISSFLPKVTWGNRIFQPAGCSAELYSDCIFNYNTSYRQTLWIGALLLFHLIYVLSLCDKYFLFLLLFFFLTSRGGAVAAAAFSVFLWHLMALYNACRCICCPCHVRRNCFPVPTVL